MMKKKYILFIFSIFFSVIMCISGIFAMINQDSNPTINSGIVDIDIETYKMSENDQIIRYGEEETKVYPGDQLSIIPQISNRGLDCYLRIKVNYLNDEIDFKNYVTNFTENFNKHQDGYYYLDRILNKGESIRIFDTLKIPEDITLGDNNGKIKLEIIVQAIQAKNFEPDYSLNNPWKDINPTETVNNSYNIITNNDNNNLSIKFENDTNKDIKILDEFFENIENIMPGDVFYGNIEISNKNKENVKYFLNINYDGNDKKAEELLEKLNLKITNENNEIVYNGSLLYYQKIELGEYYTDSYDKLKFEISAPIELNNEFERINSNFSFVFSNDFKQENKFDISALNPKTWDYIDWVIAIFLMSSIGLIIVILLAYKEKKKNID